MKNITATIGTLGLLATTLCVPMTANAASPDRSEHRQETKNTWRNVTIGSAVVGLLGLAEHNDTIAAIGAAGALYSGYRYDEDRQSQDRHWQDNRRDDNRYDRDSKVDGKDSRSRADRNDNNRRSDRDDSHGRR